MAWKEFPTRGALVLAGKVGTAILWLGLPLLVTNVLLRAFPYRATVAGVPFKVEATLFTRTGFSADTSVGSWEFPKVDGLPIGVHVSPVDVDLLRLSKAASPDASAYVERLKDGFSGQVPLIVGWLVGLTVLGVLIGMALAALLGIAIRYLRGMSRQPGELRLRVHQCAAAGIVVLLVAGYGVLTYNRDWTKQSRLTGTLGAVQLFPSQLEQFYNRQSKAYDVLSAVIGIQAALQARIDAQTIADTAYNIMFISDMHLAAEYPLVEQYVTNFDIKLIINTGDETEFGTGAELTPTYLQALRRVTAKAPMIWLAGNHDSPEIARIMASIPGVHVLGTKTRQTDGSYTVTGSQIDALGLAIAGVPDPRVYGAVGAYGSGSDSVTNPLEKAAMDAAVKDVDPQANFDIVATHEPSAADELAAKMPGRVRQTNAGHTHAQNSTDSIQKDGMIKLVEGSTGAGGLDNINRNVPAPPVEFSIESVAANCQFTKLLRFQLADPDLPTSADAASVGGNVTVSTIYLTPQKLEPDRSCNADLGVSPAQPLAGTTP
jgi:predicted MPP superfamily phosphohydrolase